MNLLDYFVLFGTLLFIVGYGVYKTRKQRNISSYLLGDYSLKWGTIGLSVMATQASAITFISTPGQGYESGMSFIQNYFGLPFALLIVSAVFIPIYYKLKVYTAYEFLENRFDLKTRLLGAFLFLIQRGLAAGITIYAPAIILSSILKWNLTLTILITGLLVIIYTVSGGSRAVSLTQKWQMAVIMVGMFAAFFMVIGYIGDYMSFGDAVGVANSLDKMNAVDFDLSFEKRYTVWSGLAGGLFLSLSYFGTDQSQVQRYLGGKSVRESKMGLMFNAIFKIPMQFFILFTGVMVYVFYLLYQPPIHFKEASVERLQNSEYAEQYEVLNNEYNTLLEERKSLTIELANAESSEREMIGDRLNLKDQETVKVREEVKGLLIQLDDSIETKDSDYVFLTFILTYLPHGLIGLLIAVIFSAAMSSTSSELNALSSTTSVDFYKRILQKSASNGHYVNISKLLTLAWGILAISFALLAKNSENLIEAVNIVGSIFYGTILGIFLVAFFLKFVKGDAVFYAAIIAQMVVIVLHLLATTGVIGLGYLWYNAIGLAVTILLSILVQMSLNTKKA
ncbi:sodium:solute symporter [Marinoscillum sp. MHG1-6]|uniref:sodium:solute symporter n=1 Tax=Marinoscillum sp. MHG1-6 TaxID=2959627 RepID=UPI00215833CA|nr:sodium:solute symporter [Marinoscillum sp. MHG1-6]